jgi:drug/metabolite transporter (DMT)-like permease
MKRQQKRHCDYGTPMMPLSKAGRFLKVLILVSSLFFPRYAYSFTSQRSSSLPFSETRQSRLFLELQSQSSNATCLPVEDEYFVGASSYFLNKMNRQFLEFKIPHDESISLSFNTPSRQQVLENVAISDAAKARLLLLGAAALYGTNFALVKMIGDTIPVGINSSLRFGLATLCTCPFLLKDVQKDGALQASWLGFEVGLLNSIGYVSQAIGLETTLASESAFICSLAVVVVSLLDFVTGKALLPRQWMGVILAVLGVGYLEMGADQSFQSMTSGDALSLIQPFAFGLGFWKMEKAMQRYSDHTARMTAAQLMAVFFVSVAYALVTLDFDAILSFPWLEWSFDTRLMLSLLWTGVVTTALSIYMENLALETLSATETTLIFTTEPLWGTAFAVMVMGEQFGLNAAVGAGLIVTACIYSNLGFDGLLSLAGRCKMQQTKKVLPLEEFGSINNCE